MKLIVVYLTVTEQVAAKAAILYMILPTRLAYEVSDESELNCRLFYAYGLDSSYCNLRNFRHSIGVP